MTENKTVYKVIISPFANNRILEHFEFLARVSESAASKLLYRLTDDIKSLQKMPFRNPAYDRPYVPLLKYRYMAEKDPLRRHFLICESRF